jgi:cathepsin B
MFKLAVVGTVAAMASAKFHPVNHDMVNEIKQKATSWVPHEVHENPLAKLSVEEINGLLGAKVGPIPDGEEGPFPEPEEPTSVPATFDSRSQWPGCVHAIRDQGQCGSCWAFAATEALSDRFCIASGGRTNVVLSPEDMVSCDKSNMGCNGGYLDRAW